MTFDDLANDPPNKFITEKMAELSRRNLILGTKYNYKKKDRKRYKKILKLVKKLKDKRILKGLAIFTSSSATTKGRTMRIKRYDRLKLPTQFDKMEN